jgi:hypothetical protein
MKLTKLPRFARGLMKKLQPKTKLSRVACELPEEMANAFKAKVASKGLKIRDVMAILIEAYLKKEGVFWKY